LSCAGRRGEKEDEEKKDKKGKKRILQSCRCVSGVFLLGKEGEKKRKGGRWSAPQLSSSVVREGERGGVRKKKKGKGGGGKRDRCWPSEPSPPHCIFDPANVEGTMRKEKENKKVLGKKRGEEKKGAEWYGCPATSIPIPIHMLTE